MVNLFFLKSIRSESDTFESRGNQIVKPNDALPVAISIRAPHTIQEIALGVLASASSQAENPQALEGSGASVSGSAAVQLDSISRRCFRPYS